jgi:hypothetical protein
MRFNFSAQKLNCPACLDSEIFQLDSAQLGKVQLKLITRLSRHENLIGLTVCSNNITVEFNEVASTH